MFGSFADFGPPLAIPALSGSIRRRTVPFPDRTRGRAQIRLPLPPQRPRPKITFQSLQQRSSLFSQSKYAWHFYSREYFTLSPPLLAILFKRTVSTQVFFVNLQDLGMEMPWESQLSTILL